MHIRAFIGAALLAFLLGACVPSEGPGINTAAPRSVAPVCKYGESVQYDATRQFHIDVLVVEDGARAFNAIAEHGNDAGQILYNTVGRYFGSMTVTFYLNVHHKRLPSHLPYLIGKGFCMGMVPVLDDGSGWSKVVVSVPAKAPGVPVVNGQVALVLSRAPLLELKGVDGKHLSFMPGIQLSIPTKYNVPITQGRFAGRPSMQIARPSSVPGISHAEKRVLDGEKALPFYFVHGRS